MDAPRTPGSFHGTAFASTFNGYDPAKKSQYQWTFAAANKRLEGAQVVKVWDPHRDWAERLADVCSIPKVCETPEECTDGVDAVVIVDDGSGQQAKYAIEPLKKGIPTFCDKPLAMAGKRAKEIADFAKQTGTPFMSASSLRFVPDIIALKAKLAELDKIHIATVACGNEFVYYGIHALSMAYAVLGRGAVSALNVGQPGRNIVRIRFQAGHDVVVLVGERDYMQGGFQINLYGKKGWRTLNPDLTDLYYYLLERFLKLVRENEVSVPIDEEAELIAALEAGKRSLKEGREVTVAEVLE
jgi:predicted dehydrogenase